MRWRTLGVLAGLAAAGTAAVLWLGRAEPITLEVVEEALKLGVRRFWMQPGAENPEAIGLAESQGASVIHDGPCLLVVLGYRE